MRGEGIYLQCGPIRRGEREYTSRASSESSPCAAAFSAAAARRKCSSSAAARRSWTRDPWRAGRGHIPRSAANDVSGGGIYLDQGHD
eukprot:1187809-Prorocentrum_minimum.AAC.2